MEIQFSDKFLVSSSGEVISVFNVWRLHKNFDTSGKVYEEYMECVKVYAVRDDKNGYPQFLIYENGEWKYVSAKHFRG